MATMDELIKKVKDKLPQYNARLKDDGRWYIYQGSDPLHRQRYTQGAFVNKAISFKTMEAAMNYCRWTTAAEKRRTKWAKIWRKAFNNMPKRQGQVKEWMRRDVTTVPDFIKGQAKRKMKMVDGEVLEYVVRSDYTYGQQSCLARLLGYWSRHRATGRISAGHNHIYTSMWRGSVPSDPNKRELLVALSKPTGKRLARKMLRDIGRLHWYQTK